MLRRPSLSIFSLEAKVGTRTCFIVDIDMRIRRLLIRTNVHLEAGGINSGQGIILGIVRWTAVGSEHDASRAGLESRSERMPRSLLRVRKRFEYKNYLED